MKNTTFTRWACAALLVLMLVPLCLGSCGPRKERFTNSLRIGALTMPKNLNPYSATETSSTFFVDLFYDTLLGNDSTPAEYAENPSTFKFEDGTTYTPTDTSVNPLKFSSNLASFEGALPKAEGSKYGYVFFDPTEEQWKKQCERESIFKGEDEAGNVIKETDEEFMERALSKVPNKNWMRFTFKINKDFKWSDGEAFTANDIKFTYDYIVKHKGALASVAFFLTDYFASSVDEDGDLIFELSSNNYTDMKAICTAIIILPEHIWKDIKNPAAEKNTYPVGTGAYYIEDGNFIADSTITATYREDYAESLKNEEFAYEPIKHIVMQLMSNEDVLLNAMQNGDVDFMLESSTAAKAYAISTSSSYSNVKISSTRNDFVTTLLFNIGPYGAFASDKLQGCSLQIRQAISLAISQETLIENTLHGMGVRVGDGLVQDFFDHARTDADGKYIYHETNVEKANAILDETPYKKDADGNRGLSFKVLANTHNEVIVREIANQLKAIGVDLDFEMATSTYADVIKQQNHPTFDMIINSVTYTADKLLMFDARNGVYPDGSCRLFNYSGNKDEQLSKMMKEMEECANVAKQYELCKQVQTRIAELCYEIPLYSGKNITFYSCSRWTGWVDCEGSSIWNGYSMKYLHPVQ